MVWTEQNTLFHVRLGGLVLGLRAPKVGNGPNTVSGSTVSNTELSEIFALTELRGEN